MPDQDDTIQTLAPQPDLNYASPGPAANFFGRALGLPEAIQALRGQQTPEEAQNFFMSQVPNLLGPEVKLGSLAAMGLLPAAKMGVREQAMIGKILADWGGETNPALWGKALLHPETPGEEFLKAGAALKQPSDLSEEAIAKHLANNPGASIFDIAGTHVAGPSTPWMSKSGEAWTYLPTGSSFSEFNALTREGVPTRLPTHIPDRAVAAGFNVPLAHGTVASEPFTEFKLPEELGHDPEIGVHAGSPAAANFFAVKSTNWPEDLPRVYPLVMHAGKSLSMPDIGSWGVSEMRDALAYHPEFKEELKARIGSKMSIQELRDLIKSKGYSSIKYINDQEDPGHMSYIALDPNQFRSPWAAFKDLSSRNLLAGLAGGAVAAPAVTPQIKDYIDALRR